MKIMTRTLADYTVFAICGEKTNEEGKVSLRVIDFAGENLYNDFVDEGYAIGNTIIDKEIFDEQLRLTGFSLPNGTDITIEYNDVGQPTLLRTSFGNIKEIQYYESGCLKSVKSYSSHIRALFYNLDFKDGEVNLNKNGDTEVK